MSFGAQDLRMELLYNVQQGQAFQDLQLRELLEDISERLIEEPVHTRGYVFWKRVASVLIHCSLIYQW